MVVKRSLLDIIYCNKEDKILGAFKDDVGRSDHQGVRVVVATRSKQPKPQCIRKRCYRKFDIVKFLYEIQGSQIDDLVCQEPDLDTAAEMFSTMFSSILNNNAPVRTIHIRRNYNPSISETTKELMGRRKVLQELARSSDDPQVHLELRGLVREIKAAVRRDKREGASQAFKDCAGPRELWRTAKRLLGMSRDKAPTTVLDEEGDTTSNPQDLADNFNAYFINKIKDLREEATSKETGDPLVNVRRMMAVNGPVLLTNLKKLDRKGLRKIMKAVKSGRSCGSDGIDGFSLKVAYPLVEESLLHLVNLSLEKEEFASVWKPLTVAPHYKKGSRILMKNYRPVCNLVEVGKVVERAVAAQMIGHMEEQGLLNPNLHGGLGGLSPLTAHIQLQEQLMEVVSNRELAAAIMIDQTAAYDLMDHDLITAKMREYHLGESFIRWMRSYLTGRVQRTKVQARTSQLAPVEVCGAPQGSIMAGLLHIISSNDCPSANDVGLSTLYVDDQTDVVRARNQVSLQEKAQRQADLTSAWMRNNRMVIAPTKTKVLLVTTKEMTRRRELGSIAVMVEGHLVENTESERHLGLTVDSHLSWSPHIRGELWRPSGDNIPGLVSQLTTRATAVRRLMGCMSAPQLRNYIEGTINSVLLYCLPVYGNCWGTKGDGSNQRNHTLCTKDDMRRLQVIQNKVLRCLVFRQDKTPWDVLLRMGAEELVKKTKMMSINQMAAMAILGTVFGMMASGKPEFVVRRLVLSGSRQNTMRVVRPTSHQLRLTGEGFLEKAARLWNLLPIELRRESNKPKFKMKAKQWIEMNVPAKPR